jgi:transposase
VPKLTQRHLAQRHHDAAPPFLRQHLPNRRRRTFAHRGIQANAPGRAALGIQLSVIRRISSIYQRYCQWYIENYFCRIKDWRRIATRYDKLARNFLAATALSVHSIGSSCESRP